MYLSNGIGIKAMKSYEKYLGLPIMVGQSRAKSLTSFWTKFGEELVIGRSNAFYKL